MYHNNHEILYHDIRIVYHDYRGITNTYSQLIIDTHVEEICTLCSEECTSSSLLVLRLEMYIYIYIRAVR